jgi:hypothetical protein
MWGTLTSTVVTLLMREARTVLREVDVLARWAAKKCKPQPRRGGHRLA